MGKLTFPLILLMGIGVLVGVFVLGNRGKAPEQQDSDVLSRVGVHWHPEVKVFVKGQEQKIPSNIGISASQMGEVHTHDDLPKIHYELAGPVTKQEASLGAFFKAWGQVFDGRLTVEVNGKPVSDGLNYVVNDNDKIRVLFE